MNKLACPEPTGGLGQAINKQVRTCANTYIVQQPYIYTDS